MRVIRRFVVLPLLLAVLPVGAEVYKWTDETGKVHYSDAPPPGQKARQVKLPVNSLSGPAVVSRSNAPGVAKGKVRVFSAVWCGYCKLAKAHLAKRGVPYEEIDVEQSASGEAEYRRLGGRGVPILLVGEQRMDGFDPAALDVLLKAAGY
mgnify:FL=1|jgi:glutaredoxin